MKTNIRIILMSVITVMTVAISNSASATVKKPVSSTSAVLSYAGKINNQPVFQLDLNNLNNEKYSIVLRDEFGTLLYEETVNGINISRKYMLDVEEFRGVDVNFEVRSLSNPAFTNFTIRNSVNILTESRIEKK